MSSGILCSSSSRSNTDVTSRPSATRVVSASLRLVGDPVTEVVDKSVNVDYGERGDRTAVATIYNLQFTIGN